MEAHNKSLYKDIIEGTYRQYTIPVYQRNYTWEKKQCRQLYDDVIACIEGNRKHYLGSLVYAERESDDNGETFTFCQIIDGQQRLTTVILLLKAIYDSIQDPKNRVKLRIYDSLYNENCDESYKLKLKSVDNDNAELMKILLNNFDDLDPISNVTKNYYYFLDRIKQSNTNGIDSETLFRGICNLEIVEIKLDELDKPQLIFESINSTGKGLNNAELIRNFLLMGITNAALQKQYYEKYWVTLHNLIGSMNIETFFYDYLVMKDVSYISETELYDNFKKYYRKQENIDSVFEDIIKFARYYKLIVCNDSNIYSEKTNNLCKIFGLLRHNTIYSFLMNVCDDFSDITELYKQNSNIDERKKELLKAGEEEFNKIIEFFGNYAIRRNICEIPSSSLRRFYVTLYKNIFKNHNNKDKYYKSIESFLCSIITSDQFPTDDNFREHLIEVNLYKKSNLLNMFFELIENKGKEKIDWDNLSIEHILPQTPDKGWKEDLGEEYQYTYEKYLNTLGNLSITGYNSEYKNKPFKVKQQQLLKKLENNNLKVITLNKELLDETVEKWNEKIIVERAKRLSDCIIEKYSYPKEIDTTIEFDTYVEVYYDENEKGFVIDGDYKLVGFKMLNKKVNCSTYKDVYKNFLVELYKINPAILNKMAEDNWKYEKAMRVYISSDKNLVSQYSVEKISKDINIYIETCFNRDAILELIKNIIEKYNNELELNDFCLLFENVKADE